MFLRFIFGTAFFRKTSIVVFSLLCLSFVFSSCSGKKPAPNGTWITLKRGDTMYGVSRRFSVDLLTLQRVNDIYDPKDVKAGTKIFIPTGSRKIKRRVTDKKRKKVFRRGGKRRFIWPVGGVISSGYGRRHGKMHRGIDLTRDRGRMIKAAAGGRVTFLGWKKGFGKTVIIDHGQGVTTLYAHNSKIYVRKGRRVRQGSIISKMGSTGTSNGIHLHFEIRIDDKTVNPLRYLPVR